MFILHYLPDTFLAFVVNAVLIAGIVGCVLSFFVVNKILRFWPPFASYYKIAQIISVVVLLSGVYFKGGYSSEMAWRERVREMEARVAAAEKESQAANDKLADGGKQKIKIIREKGVIIKQYVDREVSKYDNQCVIPSAVVKAHNAAAENKELK